MGTAFAEVKVAPPAGMKAELEGVEMMTLLVLLFADTSRDFAEGLN